MKWLLFLTLIACSSHKATVTENIELEKKPVSPLTVKPCLCMKIYQPVCAEGVNYGNSCEAECNGHTKWTEGGCNKSQKKK